MGQDNRPDLESLRTRIDELDREILALLNARANLSIEVGRAKGQGSDVFVPAREAEVLARLVEANPGPLRRDHLAAIYREILSASRVLQRPLRVAYLGPAATFTHQAALERFGQSTEFEPAGSISDIFAEVQRGAADYGVVPVENSTEGPVQETLDLLAESELKVSAEVTLPISQCLLSRSAAEEVRVIYSHPQAVAQTRHWVAEHLPGREVTITASTARAAELAGDDAHGAAIAPRLAAEVYGLNVLASDIQDMSSNYTRFFIVGWSMSDRPTGRDKTALVFSIRDRVGALRDLITVFSDAEINLSAIQSRPSHRKAWDYLFFVELQGHVEEPRIQQALVEAEQHCVSLKVLGAWPYERSEST